MIRLDLPLIGHRDAQRHLLMAAAQGRLPHALLLSGPRGIGKATFAQFVTAALVSGTLAEDAVENAAADSLFGDILPPSAAPETLHIDPNHPQVRLFSNNAHPDVLWITRPWDEKQERQKSEIPVELVREAIGFARRTPALSRWRVIVVDAVDELNTNAANALLKILEEPPAGMILLLVSHMAARVLPTIRSRCRVLPLQPLDEADFATLAARLYPDALRGAISTAWRESGGRIGAAGPFLSSAATAGAAAWRGLLPRLGTATAQEIQAAAESLGGSSAEQQEERLLAAAEIERLFTRRIRMLAETQAPRLQVETLFTLHTTCRARLQAMERLNLDPRQVFLHIFSLLRTNPDLLHA